MTFPYGSPEAHYEAVRYALAFENSSYVRNVIAVTRRVAPDLPADTRQDIRRVIADEVAYHRVPSAMVPPWMQLARELREEA